MDTFRPFGREGTPINEQFMEWTAMVREPYDKMQIDPYSRTRIILANGLENNAVLMSHSMHRMMQIPEVARWMAAIRRADSQHQQLINWLNPVDQSIIETTVAYEQVAVDLTANLAKNEPDPYVKQTLDFALLEDFDHLFRFSCLLELLEGKDPESIVKGNTEIKPGRPTMIEHRHPDESMRKHYDKDTASIKTKMNYATIVSGEQQTELYYKSHGFMFGDDIARQLYAEIAEIEEQHVSQYGMLGDPRETMLEKLALLQLNEAYNYYSFAQAEPDPRLKGIWEMLLASEIGHVMMVNELMNTYEKRNLRDVLRTDSIEPLVVFEPNKDYVNRVLEEQIDLAPSQMSFVRIRDLPDNWASFLYQAQVNADGVPSEYVVAQHGGDLASKVDAPIRQVIEEMIKRMEQVASASISPTTAAPGV